MRHELLVPGLGVSTLADPPDGLEPGGAKEGSQGPPGVPPPMGIANRSAASGVLPAVDRVQGVDLLVREPAGRLAEKLAGMELEVRDHEAEQPTDPEVAAPDAEGSFRVVGFQMFQHVAGVDLGDGV